MKSDNIERQYVVLKISHINNYLTDEEKGQLLNIEEKIKAGVTLNNKTIPSGVFIDQTFPIFEDVKSLLIDMTTKTPIGSKK